MKLLKKHSQTDPIFGRGQKTSTLRTREREKGRYTLRERESARERERESGRERTSNNFYTLSTIGRKVYVIFLSVHLSSSLSFFLIFSHLFLIRSVYLSFSIFLHSFPSLSFSEYLSLSSSLSASMNLSLWMQLRLFFCLS